MIKGSIQEEYVTIINTYASNIGVLQYVRQMLTSMKGEINSNTIIVGDTQSSSTFRLVYLKIQLREEGVESLQSIDLSALSIPEAIIGISHCRLKVILRTGSHTHQLLQCHV